MDAAREVHPLKSIGCFIKKPITTEQLLKRIRACARISQAIIYSIVLMTIVRSNLRYRSSLSFA